MKRSWRIVFLVLTIIISIPYAIALLSPIFNPHTFYIPSVLALGFPFLTILMIALLILWLRYSWKIALIPFSLLIIAIPAIDRTFQFAFDKRNQEKNTINIATYNMYGMKKFNEFSEKKKLEEIDEWHKLERQFDRIDVLCLQEYNQDVREFFLSEYEHEFGASCEGHGNTRILSKYPVLDKGCIYFPKYQIYKGIWADIMLPQDTIRVFSIHLESNKISDYERELSEYEGSESTFVYNKVYQMLRTYKDNLLTRVEQIGQVMDTVNQSPYPVVLAGDFNDIPQSYIYHLIANRFEDTFQSKGSGIDKTYAGKIPFLRIDYIFTDKEFEHIDFTVGNKVEISDHYPVLVSIRLNK